MKKHRGGQFAESDVAEDGQQVVDPEVVKRKLDRHLVPWLFTLGILCYLDRTNLSFAALDLNRDLHLSCATYGLGASLFFVSYALFQLPSTVVCARLGAHVWLSANIVAWGAVAALFSLASSVPLFLALRFLLGATESAAFPGMWYHLSTFYSEAELGPAYAKVASCTALAQVAGAPLAAAILALDGAGGLRGWQWLFILEGAATVAFGALLRLCLAPSPAKARMLTRAEREWLSERQDAARAAAGGARGAPPPREGGACGGFLAQLRGTMGVVRDWRILWLSACWLLVAAVMFGVTFFMPLLVHSMFAGGAVPGGGGGHGACSDSSQQGGGEQQGGEQRGGGSSLVALATAVPFCLAALGMNINARLAGRANERHRHAGAPLVLGGASLGLVPLAARVAGPGLAFALLSAAAGFCWSFHGPFFSWPAVLLPAEQAAAGFAFINSVGAVGGFIGPYMLGLLSDRGDGGFATAMLVLAAFLLAAGTGILLFPAPGRRDEEPVAPLGLKPGSTAEYDALALEERAVPGHYDLGLDGGGSGDEEEGGPRLEGPRRGGWQGARHARPGDSSSSASQLSEMECQPIVGRADGGRA